MQRSARESPAEDLQDLVDRVMSSLLQESDPVRRYQALTQAQQVFDILTGELAIERARAAAQMHSAGLSYAQIAEALGFTRARAQQLVERAPATTQRPLAMSKASDPTEGKIAEYLSTRVRQLLAGGAAAEEIGARLFADAAFRSLQLGTLLATPKRQIIAAAVDALDVALTPVEAERLTEGVSQAAKLQQAEGRDRAMAAGLLVAVGAALLVSGKN
jgi:hypothetical protein